MWEIPQRVVIKMAADRGAFIDQSQSLNIHIAEPNYGKLTSMHFYAWKLVGLILMLEGIVNLTSMNLQGLKTGMYYLRTKPAASAIQFTVDKSKLKATPEVDKSAKANEDELKNREAMVCSLQNKDDCLMCGS